jgi:hypothetical protein
MIVIFGNFLTLFPINFYLGLIDKWEVEFSLVNN